MKQKILNFEILDIIKIKRNQLELETKNKETYVLSCRICGSGTLYDKNRTFTFEKGDILYIPADASYTQKTDGEELIAFHLGCKGKASDKIQTFSISDKKEICRLFTEAEKAWKSKKENYIYKCMSYLYSILSYIGGDMLPYSESLPKAIEKSIHYLDLHIFDTDLSLNEVCRKSFVSRVYFNRVFKKAYEMTPVTYINSIRIKRAAELIKTDGYTNSEIAELCGFNDIKYFYTVFKKYTGKTCREYKNSI